MIIEDFMILIMFSFLNGCLFLPCYFENLVELLSSIIESAKNK